MILLKKLAKYKLYSSLDLKSGYHQIPIKEEDKPYTAFEANGKFYQFYQFCRIPFGVTNGVACFQRIFDKIIIISAWIIHLLFSVDTQVL